MPRPVRREAYGLPYDADARGEPPGDLRVLVGQGGVLVPEGPLGRDQVGGDQIREVVREGTQLVPDLLVELIGGDVGRQRRQRRTLLAGSTLGVTLERTVLLAAVPSTRATPVGVRRPAAAALTRYVSVPLTVLVRTPLAATTVVTPLARAAVVTPLTAEGTRTGPRSVVALEGTALALTAVVPAVGAIFATLAVGGTLGEATALPARPPVVAYLTAFATFPAEGTRTASPAVVPLIGGTAAVISIVGTATVVTVEPTAAVVAVE